MEISYLISNMTFLSETVLKYYLIKSLNQIHKPRFLISLTVFWQPYISITTQLPHCFYFFSTALYNKPLQPNPSEAVQYRQAGKPQPTLPLQPARCPKNNEGWREPGGYSGREWTAEGLCRWGLKIKKINKKCYPLFTSVFFFFYLFGTLPNRID